MERLFVSVRPLDTSNICPRHENRSHFAVGGPDGAGDQFLAFSNTLGWITSVTY